MSEAVGLAYEQDIKWSSPDLVFSSRFERSHGVAFSMVPRLFEMVVNSRSIHLPKIEILGIPFAIKEEDARVVLESERWPSLRASGAAISDAIAEMRSLLSDVIEEYVLCSEDQLSPDSREFRHYLISTMI